MSACHKQFCSKIKLSHHSYLTGLDKSSSLLVCIRKSQVELEVQNLGTFSIVSQLSNMLLKYSVIRVSSTHFQLNFPCSHHYHPHYPHNNYFLSVCVLWGLSMWYEHVRWGTGAEERRGARASSSYSSFPTELVLSRSTCKIRTWMPSFIFSSLKR